MPPANTGTGARRFRKKPVEVEAVEFTGTNHDDVAVFMGCDCGVQTIKADCPYDHSLAGPRALFIRTLEGSMRADRGDWIVKGVAGEFYPCKPDIFEATYEPVEVCELCKDSEIVQDRENPVVGVPCPNCVGARPKAAAWELWRGIHSELGALEAICDELPEGPTGGRLRGYIEHGIPESIPIAEQALRDAGLEPDEAVAEKTYCRGYQTMVLLRREEESGKRDPEAWRQDPEEFMAEVRAADREAKEAASTPEVDHGC